MNLVRVQCRQFLVLSGEQGEVITQVQALLAASTGAVAQCVWVSTHPCLPQAIPAKKAHTLLGQECDAIVWDAHSGLDVNAFAALSGTLRGGGTLYLLTPALAAWAMFPDPDYRRFTPYPYTLEQVNGRFLQRFVRLLQEYSAVSSHMLETETASDSQAEVVAQIVTATAPVVLTADRGRGKSAALGMAASQLLQQGQRVLLTAPAKATVVSVFKHADIAFTPTFIAPDDLLQTLPAADVLLVDEAAAIPIPLLLQMLMHYPRCVFATTIHGYEGSGRGFVLRFQQALAERYPAYHALRLTQPIRWAANDPLETFINRVLLLDAELYQAPFFPRTIYQQLDRDALVHNESLLRQIFGLLVAAHYQTRPSDLRQLLDAPALSVHVLMAGECVVAVALLSREGGLDAELTAAIQAGKRRPHGHLVPQTLTFHAQMAGAAGLVCERVMRIAVHPAYQGQGLGAQLLTHLREFAAASDADYLSVSYAHTPALQRFWERAGLAVARIGFRKDTASGSHSVVQVQALSVRAVAFFQGLSSRA